MSILCYHAVDPTWRSPLAVTPEVFERHCAWLARARTVVPLDVALNRLDRRGRPGRGVVALTFDDGFAQLQEHVFPTLARFRLPATVFVVAATLTDQGHPVDWVDTPPPWPLDTLTVEQLEAVRDQGIDIGSHSYSHRTLTDLEPDEVSTDLRDSRELLEDLFRSRVPHLAYPRGKHNEPVRRAAQAAGFTHGLALPEQREPLGPYAVPRVGIFPGNGVMTLRGKTDPLYLNLRHSRIFPFVRSAVRRR